MVRGFLKNRHACFELSHSIESSLRSLNDNSKLKSDDYKLLQLYTRTTSDVVRNAG